MKPCGQGLVCVGSFLIIASISLAVLCLFKFSDSSWLIVGNCMFVGIYPFCPGGPVGWYIVVHNISLQSFVFPWCQLLFLLFHFWFYVGPFSFFLDESDERFVHLIYLFKEPAPGLIDLLNVFLDSISFISALIFIISFFLLTLVFIFVLFQVPLSMKLDCLFELFLDFWDRSICYEFLSSYYFPNVPQILGCCVHIVISVKVWFLPCSHC